ncbi:MAG: DNA-processing protein DprA [Eubacterium sp.]|nr:DNA-processing protein DprA [Eubacterium sp.]
MMKKYDYWLCSIDGVGNRSIEKLLAVYENAEEIYKASESGLAEVLKPKQLQELMHLRQQWNLEGEYMKLQRAGIGFCTLRDLEYPERLKNIPDAPYGIFYRGTLPKEDCLSVAMIGARDCSEYGRYVATELGKYLGEMGVQVISGMARGIDGISQEAALGAGGFTAAVLGCGVDVCYPRQNKTLYEKILKQGCILSSYSPGTLPKPQNFPPRNRIVSGLADVIVVIEARNKSGTLITVDMALEQGKEVYVVPGRITDRLSDGCNRLLKQGAGVLLSPVEFLEEVEEMWRGQNLGKRIVEKVKEENEREGNEKGKRKSSKGTETEGDKIVHGLPENLWEIYTLLDFMPKSTEKILEQLHQNITISELNVKLMKLCLLGVAAQETPGHFYKVH